MPRLRCAFGRHSDVGSCGGRKSANLDDPHQCAGNRTAPSTTTPACYTTRLRPILSYDRRAARPRRQPLPRRGGAQQPEPTAPPWDPTARDRILSYDRRPARPRRQPLPAPEGHNNQSPRQRPGTRPPTIESYHTTGVPAVAATAAPSPRRGTTTGAQGNALGTLHVN